MDTERIVAFASCPEVRGKSIGRYAATRFPAKLMQPLEIKR